MKHNYLRLALLTLILGFSQLLVATEYYVATTGSDQNPGTKESPFGTIQKAVDAAAPGDVIYVFGGRYKPTKRILINKAGRADARICLFGVAGEQVIIDGSEMVANSEPEFKMSRCIYVNHLGNYWHFKNLEMCNAKDNGMKLEGSYNIVENCRFYDNNDTGLQLGMYKEFTYEETKSFPISGEPQYNPNYSYSSHNIILNCDSYYNYDAVGYGGKGDDGGDADGFAAKLFPGPGNEFIGCRAWNNSDDNWDLYMVYHPVLIKDCWSYKAGYDKNGTARKNGNGFKLGGGGSAGGINFNQSVGAHVIMNCVSFGSLHKGFDQNNAQEGMYLFNNLSFDNEYNYRFPTVIDYGVMYLRNNVGWGASKENHEFFTPGKDGYTKYPDSDYNSWTTLDSSSSIKESTKVNGQANKTKNRADQFVSLSEADFKAPRQADGSLPDNGFARLKETSELVDAGQIIANFAPVNSIPADLLPLHYKDIANITIDYAGKSADMGAFELEDPAKAKLSFVSGSTEQTVYIGTAIEPITYKWGGATTDVTVTGIEGTGLVATKNPDVKTVVISGTPTATVNYSVTTVDGESPVTLSGVITVSTIAPGTLVCSSDNLKQTVNIGAAIEDIIIEWGGGATDVTVTDLPDGLQQTKSGNTLKIVGTPNQEGSFTVTTVGGMKPLSLSGSITRVVPSKVLTGNWYSINESYEKRHADLQGNVVTLSSDSYTSWNPTYTETGGATPFGHAGAIVVGRSGGYVQFELPSLMELKVNMYTTGGRTVNILYGTPGTDVSTWKKWDSGSFSKGTFSGWDMMAKAGIEETKEPIAVRFVNMVSGGEIRIYDLFIRVFDQSPSTGVAEISEKETFKVYQTETAFISYGDIASMKVYNLSGQLVSQSVMSQAVSVSGLAPAVYILHIVDKHGRQGRVKIVKR
ncbi:T9SS C-terminal target domain-containing protein [Bacteroides sp. 214]|uniref:T9SS type A sorting domain-containing protein n=1 Tax=Bacteroides sp. 214 TaxID=2302935 RepID=UPI0013D058B2|nr:T9SS type A sorting domain-containing protein [Bacteroides sp. 214]NDW13573.1 T9SS C-terminal target domain-containing protein [Bacteroides sp. 214]